ncbi:MAG: signal peptidase II [Enterobacteriaceae bacterium]
MLKIKKIFYILSFLSVILLDQSIKFYVINKFCCNIYFFVNKYLNIIVVLNKGVVLGLFSKTISSIRTEIYVIFSLIIMCCLFFFLNRTNINKYLICIIIGGASSNLIDRILWTGVIDFIDIHFYNYHLPIFNISDLSIILTYIFLIIKKNR